MLLFKPIICNQIVWTQSNRSTSQPSHSLILLLDGVCEVESKDHATQLEKANANAESSNSPNVALNFDTENIQAALSVDLHCSLERDMF